MNSQDAPNFIAPSIAGNAGAPGTSPLTGQPSNNNGNASPGLEGGGQFFDFIMNQLKNGLPKDVENIYTKRGTTAINNAYTQGKNDLSKMAAQNQGMLPAGYNASANAGLLASKGNALSDLTDRLALAKQSGKTGAFDLYSKIYQLALGMSGQQNQFNLGVFDAQSKQGDPLLNFFTSILGAAGGIGAAAINGDDTGGN